MVQALIPAFVKYSSIFQNVQADSGAHSMGTGVFQKVKRPGREANQSLLPSAVVKIDWSYTSTPPISLRGVDRENFLPFIYSNITSKMSLLFNPNEC